MNAYAIEASNAKARLLELQAAANLTDEECDAIVWEAFETARLSSQTPLQALDAIVDQALDAIVERRIREAAFDEADEAVLCPSCGAYWDCEHRIHTSVWGRFKGSADEVELACLVAIDTNGELADEDASEECQ